MMGNYFLTIKVSFCKGNSCKMQILVVSGEIAVRASSICTNQNAVIISWQNVLRKYFTAMALTGARIFLLIHLPAASKCPLQFSSASLHLRFLQLYILVTSVFYNLPLPPQQLLWHSSVLFLLHRMQLERLWRPRPGPSKQMKCFGSTTCLYEFA